MVPFTNVQLEKYSYDCVNITKAIKNTQYKDIKFRLIQTINCMLLNNKVVNIGYFVGSYTDRFVNIIICNINEHSIYLSYTLRVTNSQEKYIIKDKHYIPITIVNCPGIFDQGSIPELDAIFIK